MNVQQFMILLSTLFIMCESQTDPFHLNFEQNSKSHENTSISLIKDPNSDKKNNLDHTGVVLNDHKISKRAIDKYKPCPGVFNYRQYTNKHFYGWITLGPNNYPEHPNQVILKVEYAVGKRLTTTYHGKLDFATPISDIGNIMDRNGNIEYQIDFPTQDPVPWITSISVNGEIICSGLKDFGSYYTGPFSLSQIVTLGRNRQNYRRPVSYTGYNRAGQSNTVNVGKNKYEPCPNVFIYQKDSYGNFYGWITLNYPTDQSIKVDVEFTIDRNPNTGDKGDLDLVDRNGAFHYKVRFPTQNPVPWITSITANGHTVCRGTTESSSNYQARYTVSHTLTIGGRQPSYGKPISYEPPDNSINTAPSRDGTQNHRECGISSRVRTLISRSQDTKPGDFPWLSALYDTNLGEHRFICGANLISTKHLLTAAHCIVKPASSYTVYVGLYDLNKISEARRHTVESVNRHRDYKFSNDEEQDTADGDIGIITLKQSIQFTGNLLPVCLPSGTEHLLNKRGVIAGWGENEENIRVSTIKQAMIKIVPDNTCKKFDAKFEKSSSPRTFCAGGDGSVPCQGDSGGGILLQEGNRLYIHGIISLSIGKNADGCDSYKYAIFADVGKYMDWINDVMDD